MKYLSILIYVLLFLPLHVFSQSVEIQTNLSNSELLPGEEVSLTLTVDEAVDAFFFSVEVEFDSEVLEYVSIENVGLTTGGLNIAEITADGLLGASVSRTSPLVSPESGDLMELTLIGKERTDVGLFAFSFLNQSFYNSADEEIVTDPLVDASFNVQEDISSLALTTPAVIDVAEGDQYFATSDVYANGVSQDAANSSRVTLWVGINADNTDPSTWDESVWELMDFSEESEGSFQYEKEIAFQRPLGTYYVATRAELDTQPGFKYGGIGGFWSDPENPSAEFTISEQPPFRYTLVEWNFDDETLLPSSSIPQNDNATIETVGANEPSYTGGASGRAASASGWDGFDEANPKYWLVTLSTENLECIRLSSKQSSSGTGPRDFQIQISLDNVNWTDLGSSVTVTGSFNDAFIDQIQLPVFAENQTELFIRWLNASDINVNGEEGINSGGTSRIDDILISGVNPNAERIEVWPGDTNDDTFVDETDVLPLTAYWASQGPEPVYSFRNWEERAVEAWIPIEATYADANGDGIVNQNDLLAIGLNFGESRSGTKQRSEKVISSLTVPNLKAGEEFDMYLESDEDMLLSGLSFRVAVNGIGESEWQLQSIDVGSWGEVWSDDNRLIEFIREQDSGVSAAIAHRGFTQPKTGKSLIKMTIRAVDDWSVSPEVVLERASVVSGREVYATEDIFLSFDDSDTIVEPGPTIPERTELLANYPNPFNPSTTIQYRLSSDSNVKIDVFNSVGRKVATILDQQQQAGEYDVTFNADNFSSGIYYYRLQTSDFVRTRSMVLIK